MDAHERSKPHAFSGLYVSHEHLRLHQGILETDFIEDLKKFDVPTLILHGDDDQIVPMAFLKT